MLTLIEFELPPNDRGEVLYLLGQAVDGAMIWRIYREDDESVFVELTTDQVKEIGKCLERFKAGDL